MNSITMPRLVGFILILFVVIAMLAIKVWNLSYSLVLSEAVVEMKANRISRIHTLHDMETTRLEDTIYMYQEDCDPRGPYLRPRESWRR